jgi:hypothetical protein
MNKFNISDTKSLEDHFHSDMFRWHIYHRYQGERVHTESWDATGGIKSLLLCTHCLSHAIQTDIYRAGPALYTHCECVQETFGVNSLSLIMVVYIPPKHVGVKVIF